MEKCNKCGATKYLTTDHIIPLWIYKRAQLFNFENNFIKNLGKKNTQILCEKCNTTKSGGIDVDHPLGKWFWTGIRDPINKALKNGTDKNI